jgi:hypothetical protein
MSCCSHLRSRTPDAICYYSLSVVYSFLLVRELLETEMSPPLSILTTIDHEQPQLGKKVLTQVPTASWLNFNN